MLVEQLSLAGQYHAAGTAGKEAAADAFLELLDGFADGGLADVKLLGSLGDIACVGYRIKNPVG